jgi:hypothetical protein
MSKKWQRPDFQEIEVNGECTAYAGAKADWGTKVEGIEAPGQVPVGLLPTTCPCPGEAPQEEKTPDR